MINDNKTCIKKSCDNQIESLGVVMTIVQAITISGCNKAESDITITHLIQGLQTGKLEGDNLNVVYEYAPRLVQAITDGLSIKRGELRKIARAGELTTEVVIKAIASQFNEVNRDFELLPMSLGGNKPSNKNVTGTGILYGLCAVAAILALLLATCSPVYSSSNALQGNGISLQGNGIMAINHDKEFNMKLMLAKYRDKRYYEVLLKNNSGRAGRSNLAFYVTDSKMDSQIHPNQSDTSHERFKRQWGSSTLMFMATDGRVPTPYEGKTSLNKIAERRISGAVAIVTESDSSHPISLLYSVIPTQKTIGAIHHG